MNNYIISTSCKEFRDRSKQMLTGKWSIGILATLFFILLTEVASLLPFAGSIWVIIAVGPLTFGLLGVFLAMSRNVPTTGTNIFKGFNFFGKALGLIWFQALFIFLWSLLFVIPGIIAALRYSMAFYIMLDDPSKGIQQCVNESKAMMKGNNGKLFCLYLSFIGWYLLAGVIASIPMAIWNMTSPNTFGTSNMYEFQMFMYTNSTAFTIARIFTVLLSAAAMIPLMTYVYGAVTQFYNELKSGVEFNIRNNNQAGFSNVNYGDPNPNNFANTNNNVNAGNNFNAAPNSNANDNFNNFK